MSRSQRLVDSVVAGPGSSATWCEGWGLWKEGNLFPNRWSAGVPAANTKNCQINEDSNE